jgi:hypothetical protein
LILLLASKRFISYQTGLGPSGLLFFFGKNNLGRTETHDSKEGRNQYVYHLPYFATMLHHAPVGCQRHSLEPNSKPVGTCAQLPSPGSPRPMLEVSFEG